MNIKNMMKNLREIILMWMYIFPNMIGRFMVLVITILKKVELLVLMNLDILKKVLLERENIK